MRTKISTAINCSDLADVFEIRVRVYLVCICRTRGEYDLYVMNVNHTCVCRFCPCVYGGCGSAFLAFWSALAASVVGWMSYSFAKDADRQFQYGLSS